MKKVGISALCLAASMIMVPAFTMAEEAPGHDLRAGVRAGLGLGGEVEAEVGTQEFDYDMETSFSIGGFLEYTKHKNVHFGGIVGSQFWTADELDDVGIDRNTFLDISPFLKVLAPFADGKGEVYAMVPIGLTVSFLNEDFEEPAKWQPPLETTAVGMNVSILAGASYMFNETVGGLVDIGWNYHSMTHEIERQYVGGDGVDEIEITMSQFALNVGFFTNF